MDKTKEAVIRQRLLVELSETKVDVFNDYAGDPSTVIFNASWEPDYDPEYDDPPFAEVMGDEIPDLIKILVATFKDHLSPEAYEDWLDLIPPPEKTQ